MSESTRSNARRLDDLMVPLMHLMHRFTTQVSKAEDFTLAQHRVLMMLCHSGPMTVKQLQESLSIAQSTASEMIDRLVRQEWLVKRKHPDDRRITVFTLSGKAERLLKAKKANRIKVHERILEPLTEKEQVKFLESIRMILEKHEALGMKNDVKGCHGKEKK
jgi:DNA-binding MarR family transcriptional regulator